jgi:hypothetical protein
MLGLVDGPAKENRKKDIKRLKGKAPVSLKNRLPPLSEKNARTALENGRAITDVLTTWI